MVSKEEIQKFIKRTFPECPICGEEAYYKISGFAKNYFQCNSCGAKWISMDLIKNKVEDIEFNEAKLCECGKNGLGKGLENKNETIDFWQNLSAEKLEKMDSDQKSDAKPIFDSNMTTTQLEQSISESMTEITKWDYGSTLSGKLGFIFDKSSHAEQVTVRLLRAIFEQNKILIIQNELKLRELRKKCLNEKQ